MGSSEHPLQQHRSGWPLCAIWYPYVAGDQKANSKSQVPRWGYLFLGGIFAEIPNNRAFFRILPRFNNQTNSRPGQGNPKIADRRPKHALGLRFYI